MARKGQWPKSGFEKWNPKPWAHHELEHEDAKGEDVDRGVLGACRVHRVFRMSGFLGAVCVSLKYTSTGKLGNQNSLRGSRHGTQLRRWAQPADEAAPEGRVGVGVAGRGGPEKTSIAAFWGPAGLIGFPGCRGF